MTNFEPIADQQFRMESQILPSTAVTLRSLCDQEQTTYTEGLRKIVGLHKFYEDAHAAGSLLIADLSGNLNELSPPFPTTDVTQTDGVRLSCNASEAFKAYLDERANPHDERDLLSFWDVSANFYADVRARIERGARIYKLASLVPPPKVIELDFTTLW